MLRRAYWLFAHLGLMSTTASFFMGFRHAHDAPVANVYLDLILYAAFIGVHILMTTPAFKRSVFRRPEGSPAERRVYIATTIVTWLVVYAVHWPVPGFAFSSPAWLRFVGLCAMLLAFVGFFEFATFEALGSLLGMPGAELSHASGAPLLREGPYAQVRHPMYRAFFFLAFSSLLVHPNAGQLLFSVLVAGSFVVFIPFEERQILRARGDEYRAYMGETPYRLFRGIW